MMKTSASRRRSQKPSFRQKLLRWAVFVIVSVVLIVGAWEFDRVESIAMSWTTVQHVSVVGLNELERKDIAPELALSSETSLLQIQPESLAARLESHPWIRRAVVERVFPQTLAIRVEEREPVAIWRSSGKTYFLDREAHLFPPVHDTPMSDLPTVAGIPEDFPTTHDERVRDRVRHGVLVGMVLADWFGVNPTVDVHSPTGEIVAEVNKIRFQFEKDINEQWERFESLYPSIQERFARENLEVDMRYPGKVILRKRE
ncbi:MAG: FtsQ-type POTRA domain-containing protein [Nitrospira sp.]|nr:FtsQ-type POTRA domain-containing protein [Nitrospira sp.]